jgi:AraC family ethanolamine operon transcriptional activator
LVSELSLIWYRSYKAAQSKSLFLNEEGRSMEPIVTKLHTKDFDEMRTALSGWDHRYDQLKSGHFRGNLLLNQIGPLQISRNQWNRKLHYKGTNPKGTVGLAVTLNQVNDAKWLGVKAVQKDIIIQNSNSEADYVSADQWDAVVFAIPEQEFTQAASYVKDLDYFDASKLKGIASLDSGAYRKLRSHSLYYLSMLERSIQDPTISRLIEPMSQSLTSMVVNEVVGSFPARFEVPDFNKKNWIVRRAEEFVLETEYMPIQISDICKNIGVSDRALYYAFSSVTDMTPAHWLRLVRLNKVYRLLKTPDSEGLSVTEAAVKSGFIHLGLFSKHYTQLFGEYPSITLRRALSKL